MRSTSGIVVLVASILLSNVIWSTQLLMDYKAVRQSDEVTIYEQRFKGLKKALPPHAVVGYISDRPVADMRFDSDESAKYYIAQYALAPILVDYSTNHRFVVGNFHNSRNVHKAVSDKPLIPIKYFGNGTMLFQRSDE